MESSPSKETQYPSEFSDLKKRIAELEKMELLLRNENRQLRELYDRSPMAYQSLDENGCIIEVNQAWLNLLGYTLQEVVGKKFEDFLHPDWKDRFKANFSRFQALGEVRGSELKMKKKEGSFAFVSIHGKIDKASPGHFQHTNCIIHDITQLKQIEEKLLRFEEKWLKTIVSAPQIVISLDPQGRIVFANPHFLKLVGWTEQEVIGRDWFDMFIPHSIRNEIRRIFFTVMSQKDTRGFSNHENEILTRTGEMRTVAWSNVLSKDFQGNIVDATCLGVDLTEWKKAKEEASSSKARLEAALSSMMDAVFITDTEGKFINFNEACATFHKFKSKELCTKTLVEYPDLFEVYTDNGELVPLEQWAVPRALRGEIYANAEFTLRRKDTGESWIGSYSFAPIRNKDNAIVGSVVTARDVTERKRAEEELRKSEAHFRTLVQAIPDLIWLKDKEGVYLSCNKRFERLFGAAEKDIVGKTDYDFVDRELADFFRAHDKKAILAGKPSSNEEWVTFADDGHRALLDTVKTPMYDSRGTLIGVLGIGRDITERKRIEEALQQYTFLMKEMGKAAKIGGWEFDPATGKGTWTEEVARIHEVDPEQYTNVDIALSFYPDESKAKISKAIQDAVESGKPYELELELITAKGNHKWVKTIGQPFIENNKVLRVRGSFQDITAHKQAEQEREKLQIQLTQAQRMESVGRLAGGVAHDFNNMLGVILGYSEIALDQTEKSHPTHFALVEIQQAARRSANLTRQLLAFARKQAVAPEVLYLNDTVESMLSMLRRLIGEDIDLMWKPGKKLGLIKMDPSQIDQILANLCVNARDAISDTGKVIVETSNIVIADTYQANNSVQSGKYVLLAVSDDGCGMDKETLNKLFEPFFTTKELGKGTGLGLASVYGIVKQNNGFINVYSEPGVGTTFKIYLPQFEDEEERLRKTDQSKRVLRGSETILLVEDEPAILQMAKRMIEQLGYKVFTANNASQAIALAHAHAGELQLLITDVIMPEMNGRSLADNLMSICPGLKSLYMSGYTSNVIAHHGVLDEGMVFIQKPFSARDLAVKIREALARGPALVQK